jgi:hypothetical protein
MSRVCVSTTVWVKLLVLGSVCGLPGRNKSGPSLAADWSCVSKYLLKYLIPESVHEQALEVYDQYCRCGYHTLAVVST